MRQSSNHWLRTIQKAVAIRQATAPTGAAAAREMEPVAASIY
jgi:hypothetical protein